jgi:hypothetical protein
MGALLLSAIPDHLAAAWAGLRYHRRPMTALLRRRHGGSAIGLKPRGGFDSLSLGLRPARVLLVGDDPASAVRAQQGTTCERWESATGP